MNILTKAAFAKQMGVNRAYISELQKQGRLVMAGGKVMVEESLKLIEDTKDPSKQGVADRHQTEREQKQAQYEDEGVAALKEAGNINYQRSKASREHYNALLTKQEYELKARNLLPIAEVKAAIADGDAIVRNRLESMPDILASQFAVETDEQKIRLILMDYVEQTLMDLSRSFNELAKPQ